MEVLWEQTDSWRPWETAHDEGLADVNLLSVKREGVAGGEGLAG